MNKISLYGIIIKDTIVVRSPPIAKWMVGKNISFIKEWTKKKKGKIKEVGNLRKDCDHTSKHPIISLKENE